jgi:2-(1,2-epoxy-1,2-dihydrophenyl)acetyl-CoA isomerase
LTTAFIKVALSGDFGGTFYLTQLLGSAKARELYFLSDILSGEDAERIGLVNRAVDSLEVMTEAMGLAKRFADGPRVALGLMKKSLNVAERGDHGLSLDTEALNHSRSAGTADHTEGARAFVERRAPVYSGS